MKHLKIDAELRDICLEIVNMKRTEEEWSNAESSDMFQSTHYNGGYDSDEKAFCFSFFDNRDFEYWFQIPLSDVFKIASGENMDIKLRDAS